MLKIKELLMMGATSTGLVEAAISNMSNRSTRLTINSSTLSNSLITYTTQTLTGESMGLCLDPCDWHF